MGILKQLQELLPQAPVGGWTSQHFAPLDQLHMGGLAATYKLLQWLPAKATYGLDMGAGLGGCARLAAMEYGCRMIASDIDADYIAAAKLLNSALTPAPDCHYQVADSLALPFADQQFDFILSQHAMMSIADKPALLEGARRVLKPGGHLLLHEVYLAPQSEASRILYPTPWATQSKYSHLQTWPSFVALCQTLGWHIEHQQNHTAQNLHWLQQARNNTSHSPFSARLALGPEAGKMSANIMHNLQQQLLEVRSAKLTRIPI
ncbi:MAG: class I SAM-dependent methyltransferase [Gammaproteobacteria bacterium]|jgi:ubiquinone/menaquinone biosynthesis C-methylase UbiE|nr:class I SAM-dependent methyltransferase [Gammaproteobacteria bacterium]